MRTPFVACSLSLVLLWPVAMALGEAPSTAYIFPAGGQRGTTVDVRVGAHYLHDKAPWEVIGDGVTAPRELVRTERVWFEGPLIRQPASQQKEDYPQDYAARIEIDPPAATGPRWWRAWNAQGATPVRKFIVGDLPEVVEQETDGQPIAVAVILPVTINGRIFPREDVDVWKFTASTGQSITCRVLAQELGSPLDALLEVRDPQGRLVTESNGSLRGDPQLRFVAPQAGDYEVRICDSRFAGLQDYVYRLTVTADAWVERVFPLGGRRGKDVSLTPTGQELPATIVAKLPDIAPGIIAHSLHVDGQPANTVLLDVDDREEVTEAASGPLPRLPTPGIGNGRISAPGQCDAWSFAALKGEPLHVELVASLLGSPLDGVIIIKDAQGKELARGDDLPDGTPDAELTFTPVADGAYTVEVSEKFASRGGEAFAYRLKLGAPQPSFHLTAAADSLAVDIGSEKKLPVSVARTGGFSGPITLTVEGLPAGVTAAEVVVAPNQNKGEITVKVDKSLPVQTARLKIFGRAKVGDQEWTSRALVKVASGDPALDEVLLCATLPTPFRFQADYELRYVARGGTLTKTYRIERGGYEGPLDARLADRQGRHLQGVTGPTIIVPAAASEFEYTLALPPWMELGRTSRTNLMLTGEVADAAGVRHKVCFSTTDQNEQMIALVSPAPLRLSLDRAVIPTAVEGESIVPVQIHRDRAFQGAVRLELVRPAHMRDIEMTPIVADADAKVAYVHLRFGAQPGPFNQPLVIRGAGEHHGQPMVAEVLLEILPARSR